MAFNLFFFIYSCYIFDYSTLKVVFAIILTDNNVRSERMANK